MENPRPAKDHRHATAARVDNLFDFTQIVAGCGPRHVVDVSYGNCDCPGEKPAHSSVDGLLRISRETEVKNFQVVASGGQRSGQVGKTDWENRVRADLAVCRNQQDVHSTSR